MEDLAAQRGNQRGRDEVNRRHCSEIAGLSNDRLVTLIENMLDGWTVDSDERAILRILECLPCDRVNQVVGRVGRSRLLDDFHGAEWDRLMIRLQRCGLAQFREWDEDARRRFIGESSCAVLNALSLDEISTLIGNLFSGATLDEDERAIIKLIRCLPCSQVATLMRRRGRSYDDFDDEVDGAEWRELSALLIFARERC